jgi:hypothetical protein
VHIVEGLIDVRPVTVLKPLQHADAASGDLHLVVIEVVVAGDHQVDFGERRLRVADAGVRVDEDLDAARALEEEHRVAVPGEADRP